MARETTIVILTNGKFTQVASSADEYVIQNIGLQDVKLIFSATEPTTGDRGMILYPRDIVNYSVIGQGDLWAEPTESGDGVIAKTIG